MIRVEREVRVERPPEEVFAYLADPERIPEWQASVAAVERDSSEAMGVGARWRETRVFMGRRIDQTVETTAYRPGEEFAVEVVDGPIPLRVHHAFRREGDATVVSVRGEGEPGGRFRLGSRFIVALVKRQFDEDFARLREIVERGA